jgi:NAD(P)-dependent dehydrogenase (short-subunit alcohol dehydrogenase family)
MKTDWQGKRILVTGGTSGLGKALTEELLARGARVAVVARHAAPLPEGAALITADVSRKEDIHRITGEALARLGGLDVLINNASELGPTPLRLLLDTECEDLSHVLETNLVGPFRLTKALVPSFLLKGEGTVVNISSDAAVSAYPAWGAYSVSKAALDHLTRIWSAELEGRGVRFLAVDPGDMDTPMHAAAVPDADRAKLRRPRESARRILALIEGGQEGRVAA